MMCNVDSTRAFAYQWFIWRLFGLDAPEGNTFCARHYTAYSIGLNLIANVWVPLTFYIECIRSQSLAEFCETFYVAAIIVVEQLKLANVVRVRGYLKKLHVIVRQLDARLQTEEERQIINENINKSRNIFMWVFRLFTMVIASAGCFVAYAPEQRLSFPAWFPWDWQSSRTVYLLTLSLQNIGTFMMAVIALNNDTYPVAYLIMVAGHCKALALRIAKLGYGPQATHARVHTQLIECIEDHKTILQLLKTMENSLSFACFIQFVCTATALCSLSFFALYVSLTYFRILHLFFMLLSIIIETLIVCYASEKVGHEGDQMSHAIYACNWITQPVQFRRNLALMLMRSQRPIGIVTAKILPVRMRTLVAVVKGAYTMLTLLNHVNSAN